VAASREAGRPGGRAQVGVVPLLCVARPFSLAPFRASPRFLTTIAEFLLPKPMQLQSAYSMS
jgi:hypothetical protein